MGVRASRVPDHNRVEGASLEDGKSNAKGVRRVRAAKVPDKHDHETQRKQM